MSETPDTTVEETAATPPAETQEQPASETPEDLGALKRALEHEREERRQAKEELRRIREDETARADLLKEWGYEVADDEADTSEEDLEFEEDDQVAPLKKDVESFKEWRQQQEAKEMAAQIRTDLDAIHGDNDWTLDDKARRWIVSEAAQDPKGFDRAALERAHKDLIDQWEAIAAQGVERAKKPKPKPPHVTPGGQAATDTKNIVDMTPDEHRAWARERFKAKAQGG